MSKLFSETESTITKLFKVGHFFLYKSTKYAIINSGKPSPSKGECKTDTYILAKDENGNQKEFKITIKQENADFLENKMSLERATQIFGEDTHQIITSSIAEIESEFTNDYLVTFKKYGKTEEKTLKIGWKFELLNKKGGNKSGKLKLTEAQFVDIYAGTNLDITKKNSKVNGKIVVNSGIANFIFIADTNKSYNCQKIINSIIPIEEYIRGKNIYFVCKAINFRVLKDKWDGDRPLAVYVDWIVNGNQIQSKVVLDKPLKIKANKIGKNIRSILNEFKISKDNFSELKSILVDTKCFG